MVYNDWNIATDDVATEEGLRRTRTLERSRREGVGRERRWRRHLADGRKAPADDAKHHKTTINLSGRATK